VTMTASDITAHIGTRLRDLRRRHGLSLEDVETKTNNEFKASVVGAYERGERRITVVRLTRLVDLLGGELTDVLPLGPAGPARVEATITITGHHLGDVTDWFEAFRSFATETGAAAVELQVA
jgi:transcriptional regulator with XRE-family HTH domain